MKKILSLILIALVSINFFSPLTIIVDAQNNVHLEKNIASADDCKVVSATWNPAGKQQKDGPNKFFKEGVTAKIVFKTLNCAGQSNMNFTVYEADTGIQADNALKDSHLWNREIKIPSDNFTINIKLGEEQCESGATGAIGYDCDLYFSLDQGSSQIYNSKSDDANGNLYYECDGGCDTNAAFISVTSQGTDSNPIADDVQNINAQQAVENSNTYTLLAPIGDLKSINTSGGTCPGNPGITNGIGCYLNIFFKLAIGLCGALAVIMIIIAGVQYMGDESIFGKTEAKSKIFSAIMGLLIALGAYALLNTLDPALTGQNGVTVDQVSAEIEGDASAPTTFVPTGQMPSGIYCPASGRGSSINQVAKSFDGKVTYDIFDSNHKPSGKSAVVRSDGTAHLDCSGWVNTVLKCAGYRPGTDFVPGGTGAIFAGSESFDISKDFVISGSDVLINNKKLNPGDLIGWSTSSIGHVVLYVGNGMFMDSHGGKTNGVFHATGKGIGTYYPASVLIKLSWAKSIRNVKRITL